MCAEYDLFLEATFVVQDTYYRVDSLIRTTKSFSEVIASTSILLPHPEQEHLSARGGKGDFSAVEQARQTMHNYFDENYYIIKPGTNRVIFFCFMRYVYTTLIGKTQIDNRI